ncbi:MAG: hypothetical protein J6X57_01110, partial [Bacteroidales bacterium]|nr:hypothetical protein [Bacteroidales bacterium]
VIGEPASVKASATLMDSTRLVLNVYGGATFGEVQVKLPGRRGWISIPRHKEVAPEVLETYNFNKTLEKRSRNPLFIPMLRQKSPHIWSVDFADDPSALSALQSGRPIRLRYTDSSMSFSVRVPVR